MKHLATLTCLLLPLAAHAAEPARTWVPATGHAMPKYTATEGEGYFSIIEGLNGKLYIGTHANGVNSWLVEFDPKSKEMKVVVDARKEKIPVGLATHGDYLCSIAPPGARVQTCVA